MGFGGFFGCVVINDGWRLGVVWFGVVRVWVVVVVFFFEVLI